MVNMAADIGDMPKKRGRKPGPAKKGKMPPMKKGKQPKGAAAKKLFGGF